MCQIIKVDFKTRVRLTTTILPKDAGTIDVIRSAGKLILDANVPVELADDMGAVATLPGMRFHQAIGGRVLFDARVPLRVANQLLDKAARSGVQIRGWRKAG
jgi:hypothetical protein